MVRRIPVLLCLGVFLAAGAVWGQEAAAPAPDVRVACPPSTKVTITAVARAMRREKGLNIALSESLTSQDALDSLAHGSADIALVTREVDGRDRAQYPDLQLDAIPIGMQVVAIGVANDVWTGGVRTITRENMRAVYEKKITNWRDLGGPDEKITMFTFQQGQGVWEMFAEWLYGDNRKAPLPKFQIVANSQDAGDDLEFTPGSVAPLGASVADGTRCHPLGIDLPDRIAKPLPAEVAAGRYPLVRPIFAVVIGRPTLAIKSVTGFLIGPAGQALIKNSGAMGLEAVPKASPDTSF